MATATPALAPAQRIRLVTLNTWKCDGVYTLRLQAMARQLQALQPDVVALQESFASVDGHHDTARYLAQALGLYFVNTPARTKPRLFQGVSTWSHSGMACLSRWPIQRHLAFELPTVRADGQRIAQLLQIQAGPRRLALANVHFTHLPHQQRLRERQLLCILRHPWLHDKAAAAWVCGDFNAPLQGAVWPPVLAPHGVWADVTTELGLLGKVTCHPPDSPGLDLDHVISRVPGPWRAVQAQLALDQVDAQTGVAPSDHCAVCVDFEPLP